MKFFKVFTQDDVSDYMRIGSDKLKQFIINNSIPSLSFDQIIFPENFCDFGNMNLENVEFVKCTFKGRAIFESAQFKDANFDDAIFENDAIFRHTKLLNASFKRATFHGNTIFIDAQVTSIDFSEANFNAGIQYADIKSCAILKCNKATFRCNAAHQAISFSNIEILNGCFFSEAKFFNEVRFEKSMFSSNIYFDNADFFEKVSFNEATFKGSANFKKSKFYNDAYFQIETASNGMIFINIYFDNADFFERVCFCLEFLLTSHTNLKNLCFHQISTLIMQIFLKRLVLMKQHLRAVQISKNLNFIMTKELMLLIYFLLPFSNRNCFKWNDIYK